MAELFWLFPITIFASLAGLAAGAIVSDERLLRALKTACNSIGRLWQKRRRGSRVHPNVPIFDDFEQRSGPAFGGGSADKNAMRWARVFARAARHRLREDVEAVYFFGSRARGSYEKASDTDIAIILKQNKNITTAKRVYLFRLSFKILIQSGLYLQIRIILLPEMRNHPMYSTGFLNGYKV